MTEDEALRSVREARQRVVESWKGKTNEEIVNDINESGRRMMEAIEQKRQASQASDSASASH